MIFYDEWLIFKVLELKNENMFVDLKKKPRQLHLHVNTTPTPVLEKTHGNFITHFQNPFSKKIVWCRRCVCFYACFFKNCTVWGFVGSCCEGFQSHMWPISWAVVENESEDTYFCFLRICLKILELWIILDGHL